MLVDPAVWTTIFVLVVYFSSAPAIHGVRPARFRTFEVYLQYLDKGLQSSIVQFGSDGDVNGTLTTVKPDTGSFLTTNIISEGLSKDAKKNLTCCILGELAGDKGFHCYAEFYAARVVVRNFNRAHTKKLGFHGRFKIAGYGERIMKTFEQCVAKHGKIFHKCCHLATMESEIGKRRRRIKKMSLELEKKRDGEGGQL